MNTCAYGWWGVVCGWNTSKASTLARAMRLYLACVARVGMGAKRPEAKFEPSASNHQISDSLWCVTRFFSKLDQNNDKNVKNKNKERKISGRTHRFLTRKAFVFLQCQISVWRSELCLWSARIWLLGVENIPLAAATACGDQNTSLCQSCSGFTVIAALRDSISQ